MKAMAANMRIKSENLRQRNRFVNHAVELGDICTERSDKNNRAVLHLEIETEMRSLWPFEIRHNCFRI